MDILIKVLQLFLCFTILVGIHEAGHFFMARIFKIRVEKFYIFFDPWFSLFKFKRGDTEYGVGWLPLGGYVKIAGMIDESMDKEQMKQPMKTDEFRAKPAWQRFLVMIAGVVMNVLLAIVIYCGICYTWGDSYFSNQDAKWGYNFSETGKAMGFEDGDKILSVDGEQVDNYLSIVNDLIITDKSRTVVVERAGQSVTLDLPLEALISMRKNKGYTDLITLPMPTVVDSLISDTAIASGLQTGDQVLSVNGIPTHERADFFLLLGQFKGTNVALTLLRGVDTTTLTLPVSSEGKIGVQLHNPYPIRTQQYTLLESIPAGIHKTGKVISSYWEQLKLIVQPKTKMYEELGGFIAIGNIFPSQWDWQDFWLKTAFLSIILAIMNILPIPGLDGGHALFTFWEIVTRRKPSDKFMIGAQYVGLVIILGLLLYANGNDIYRLFMQ
ncbi:MAG: RIP metalloprotease RseP [Alistipes sp.]